MMQPPKTRDQRWAPPATFEEYRVGRCLGRGGMGEVYLGHDTLLDRPVAIKFINTAEPDAALRRQFFIEARAAARLQHPNVVSIYRVGVIDDHPYIVSEFVHGRTLAREPLPLPWQRALELGLGVARGLAAAHRSGVLHRDIKPSNVILTDDGQVKLLDFGLAKLIEGTSTSEPLGGSPPAPTGKWSAAVALASVSSESTDGDRAEHVAELTRRLRQRSEAALRPAGDLEKPADAARDASVLPASAMPARVEGEFESGFSAFIGSGTLSGSVSGIRGTPHYMAPELLVGEPASRRSDIYSMGVLLYELCTGKPPFADTPIESLRQVVAAFDMPSIAKRVPSLDLHFAAVVDRCLRRHPGERYGSGEELLDALEQLLPSWREAPIPEGNPYRGLLPFEAEHRALFFGRKSDIGTLIERLRNDGLVLVAADSGVGKSSLCRAGVLPLVLDGALGVGRRWSVASLVPGQRPLEALVRAVGAEVRMDERSLRSALVSDPRILRRELYHRLGEERGLVIFIDQLEELITLSELDEMVILGEVLAELAIRGGSVRVLATVRSDFLGRLVEVPALGDEVVRALYFLKPLGPEQIREAIVGPAQAKGVSFESEALIETLVEATARAGGGLPLLQFALAELWTVRKGGSITAHSLEAIGGVTGALARHADRVLGLLPESQRTIARRLLMALVTLEGTRVRRTVVELVHGDETIGEVLEALVQGRLLVARETPEGPAYELAHEALVKGWDTLRRWLEEHAEGRAVKQRLEAAAHEWHRLGRAREALWSARHLAEAEILGPKDIGPGEAEFLAASQRAIRRQRRKRQITVLLLLLVPFLIYGGVRLMANQALTRSSTLHALEGRRLLEQARRQNAEVEQLRRQAFALFDSQKLEAGEAVWARALTVAREADRTSSRASQTVEAALVADGSHDDLRGILGNILYERALAAERDHHWLQLEDLLQRLALYDPDGALRRRWETPGRVSITSSPAGVMVRIGQYVEDERHQRHLVHERVLGTTPIAEMEFGRGSYLITFSAPGHVEVRYPFLVPRGARLEISVALPQETKIPKGFVYVPPGKFLFGTSDDEAVRKSYLYTVPIHELSTGAYLIARQETTYAEWIDFLSALPPQERALRIPKGQKSNIGAAVDLHELPGGRWELTLRPVAQSFTVRSGEKVQYLSRKVHQVQDWMRMPVGGLSRDDALAYAAWLDRTGRVPGARLCDEFEWERAARGADDRELPHGNALTPDDANYDRSYGREGMGPDEVGSHPSSRSPFGIEDMAGNAIEWVLSRLDPEEGLLRSGSYFYAAMTQRSTNRSLIDPDFRDAGSGVRICASFPPPAK